MNFLWPQLWGVSLNRVGSWVVLSKISTIPKSKWQSKRGTVLNLTMHSPGALLMGKRSTWTSHEIIWSTSCTRWVRLQGFLGLLSSIFDVLVNNRDLVRNLRPDSVWILRWCNSSEITSPYLTPKIRLIHLIHLCVVVTGKWRNSRNSL